MAACPNQSASVSHQGPKNRVIVQSEKTRPWNGWPYPYGCLATDWIAGGNYCKTLETTVETNGWKLKNISA